jgi:ABC-type transport system involved in multi-copper enzyme maturation permease subunit
MTNLPDAIRTVRWMIRDTFRQSLHTKLFWVMIGVTAVCTAFCASIRVTGGPQRFEDDPLYVLPKGEAEKLGEKKLANDGVQVKDGEISFGFGAVKSPIGKTREDSVRFVQLWLAGVVADSLGLLLALVWTAGFLPTFLEPHAVTVLLAKPAPRWSIVVGKYAGVVGFVALQALLFVTCTWLALGLATGVWDGAYWLTVPLLVVNFGIFYAVSAFIAVCTRSTVAAAFGTILFWVVCWGMNFTHHHLIAYPISGMGGGTIYLLEVGYWFLPKPLDMSGIFFETLGAQGMYSQVDELVAVRTGGRFHPEASVAASAGFAAVTLGLAAYEFQMTDY